MTKLRIVAPFPPLEERLPGMMWWWERKQAWWIILPRHPDQGTPGHPCELSWRTCDRATAPPHAGWQVTGEAPLLTVTPSIDLWRFTQASPTAPFVHEGSYWHGLITAGELIPS